MAIFDEAYLATFGAHAPFTRGKDGKLAQQLVERYELRQIREWIPMFFEMRDPFIEQSGYTFGVFVACLGKVIVAHRRQQTTVVTYDTWRQFREDMQAKRRGEG